MSFPLRSMLVFSIVALALLVFAGGSGTAAVGCAKFAAPGGSDAASGSEAAPFATPQKLADSLGAAETGCLRAGAYAASGAYALSPGHGDFTLRSYPGEEATLAGIVQIPAGADGVTLADLRIEGDGSQNTVKVYAADAVLEDSEVTNAHRGRSCLILGSSSAGTAVRPLVRDNVFHACGDPANGNKDHGIYAAQVEGGEISGNLIYDSAAYALQLYPNAQGVLVDHNVVDGGPPSIRGGIVIGGDTLTASSNNVLEGNVIAFAQTYNLSSAWEGPVGAGNLVRENCLWGGREGNARFAGGVVESGDVFADPGFVAPAEADYRLAPGSPCLGAVGYDAAAPSTGAPAPAAAVAEAEPVVKSEPVAEPEPKPTAEPTLVVGDAQPVARRLDGAAGGSPCAHAHRLRWWCRR